MVCGLYAGSVLLYPAGCVQGVASVTYCRDHGCPGKVVETGRLLLKGQLLAWPWVRALSSLLVSQHPGLWASSSLPAKPSVDLPFLNFHTLFMDF